MAERNDLALIGAEKALVGFQNQVVFKPGAAIGIAARCGDRKIGGRFGFDLEIEVECDGHGIEAGAEIGRGGWQAQANFARLGACRGRSCPGALHGRARTASGVASATMALRRKASISDSTPAFSSSVSKVPRWKSMV